jgi:hypothetical protein
LGSAVLGMVKRSTPLDRSALISSAFAFGGTVGSGRSQRRAQRLLDGAGRGALRKRRSNMP